MGKSFMKWIARLLIILIPGTPTITLITLFIIGNVHLWNPYYFVYDANTKGMVPDITGKLAFGTDLILLCILLIIVIATAGYWWRWLIVRAEWGSKRK